MSQPRAVDGSYAAAGARCPHWVEASRRRMTGKGGHLPLPEFNIRSKVALHSSRWAVPTLLTRLFKFAFALAGAPYVDASQETSNRSMAWDYQHTNDAAIWDAELDKEALREAIDLAATSPEHAFEIWLALAGRGSVWSMVEVGRCFRQGIGVSPDVERSEDWYRRAAGRGSQRAMLRYSGLLRAREDYAACEAISRIDAEKHWAPAMFWLAWYRLKQSRTRDTYQGARPLLEEAASQGHPAAKWLLAKSMAHGRFGLRDILRGQKLIWDIAGALADSMDEPSAV